MYSFTRTISCCIGCLFILGHLLAGSDEASITVTSEPLSVSNRCSGTFVAHELDHMTIVSKYPVGFYESNGAGVAINDFNNDGYQDIVLANLAGDNAVFWNRGDLTFEKHPLPSFSPARAAITVDVDGDNWPDIVFTQQVIPPLYWRNQEGRGFEKEILTGVDYAGFAMGWSDIDADGDLDVVTGSYDVEMDKLLGSSSRITGVIYYENRNGRFVSTRLATRANTLALSLSDLNGDGQMDVVVGNDFALADRHYSYIDDEWHELEFIPVMPHSTMSYSAADIDNNGMLETYAVDMKPYADDNETLAAWQPVMDQMAALPKIEGDPQIMENVLYSVDREGRLVNRAHELGLTASGWSWSAKFGDLDNDGFQDLYVVNGMISIELFPHMPNGELIEENLVFRNEAGGHFIRMNEWGLNSTASGRGMSMADLDNDGDLDIVINNLMESAVLYENQLCSGSSIELELKWPDSSNTHAIGSRVHLHTDHDVYRRDVIVSSGYLSGDSSRIHFGFPVGTEVGQAVIDWSDGAQSVITDLQPGMLIRVSRT